MICSFCKSVDVKFKEEESIHHFCNLSCQQQFYQVGTIINNDLLIIHIAGPSGSGKTTLGNKLKNDKIIVKDLDDLRVEFIIEFYGSLESFDKIAEKKDFKWNSKGYQEYIDNFINLQTKPIVFVGLNHMKWWNEDLYYDMHAKYKFYIYLDSKLIFEQSARRFMNDVFIQHQDTIVENLLQDNTNTIENIVDAIKFNFNLKDRTEDYEIWNRDYKSQNYQFMSREEIFQEILKLNGGV